MPLVNKKKNKKKKKKEKARGILNPKTSNFMHPSCHGDTTNKALFNYMFF